MPKKSLLVRYRPRGSGVHTTGGGVRTTGGGVRTTGGGLKRAGCGKKRGGSMRQRGAIPPSVRDAHITKLNSIVKDAAKPGSNKTSITKRLKDWAISSHNVAQKYGLYNKGAQAARIGYNIYQSRKGRRPGIGYTPASVQSVD
jgi:hypothetical protein